MYTNPKYKPPERNEEPPPENENKKICFNYKNGNCKFGDKCRYFHPAKEVPKNERSSSPHPVKEIRQLKLNPKASEYIPMSPNIPDSPNYTNNDLDMNIVEQDRLFGLNFGIYKPNLEKYFTVIYIFITINSENMQIIIDITNDLSILLKLPYNVYISHLLYDSKLINLLSSLLQYENRWYEGNILYTSEKSKLYHILFLVYYRLIMDNDGIRNLYKIYPHFGGKFGDFSEIISKIVNPSIIFDICSVYIKNNMYLYLYLYFYYFIYFYSSLLYLFIHRLFDLCPSLLTSTSETILLLTDVLLSNQISSENEELQKEKYYLDLITNLWSILAVYSSLLDEIPNDKFFNLLNSFNTNFVSLYSQFNTKSFSELTQNISKQVIWTYVELYSIIINYYILDPISHNSIIYTYILYYLFLNR